MTRRARTPLPAEVLTSVKSYLSAGIPSMFGFWGFQSFEDSDAPGDIPYPCKGENAQWGHAVMAVGYDDDRKITNLKCKTETKGALLDPQLLGQKLGRQRLRLAALRLCPERPRPRLLVTP